VSSRANAACNSIAPAGVGSALAVIVNYCNANGFVVSISSGEMTSTASLPTSSTALPGASSSIVAAPRSASSILSHATSNCIPPCSESSTSSKHLHEILPATTISVAVAALLLFLWSRRTRLRHNAQIELTENPDRNSTGLNLLRANIAAPNGVINIVGGNILNHHGPPH